MTSRFLPRGTINTLLAIAACFASYLCLAPVADAAPYLFWDTRIAPQVQGACEQYKVDFFSTYPGVINQANRPPGWVQNATQYATYTDGLAPEVRNQPTNGRHTADVWNEFVETMTAYDASLVPVQQASLNDDTYQKTQNKGAITYHVCDGANPAVLKWGTSASWANRVNTIRGEITGGVKNHIHVCAKDGTGNGSWSIWVCPAYGGEDALQIIERSWRRKYKPSNELSENDHDLVANSPNVDEALTAGLLGMTGFSAAHPFLNMILDTVELCRSALAVDTQDNQGNAQAKARAAKRERLAGICATVKITLQTAQHIPLPY